MAAEGDQVRLVGKIAKIEGKAVTISAEGKDTVVTCTDATKYRRDSDTRAKVTLDDFKVGMDVRVYYQKADNTATLLAITNPAGATTSVPPAYSRIAGQLTRIDGKALTISVEGKETVITCNDATTFRRDGEKNPVKFEDLQVGQTVRAYARKADNVAVTVIIAKPPTTATEK